MDTEIDWASLHKDATTTLEGEFPIVVVKATAGQSQGGKPQIKATMKIESGPFANRQLFDNFTISAESSAAMRIFFGQMSVFGLDGAFFAGNPSLNDVAVALEGRRATAVVGVRQWNGQDREDVKEYKPALGGPGGGPAGSLSSPVGTGINPGGVVAGAGPLVSPVGATEPAAPAAVTTVNPPPVPSF